jgi:hypothetical protein
MELPSISTTRAKLNYFGVTVVVVVLFYIKLEDLVLIPANFSREGAVEFLFSMGCGGLISKSPSIRNQYSKVTLGLLHIVQANTWYIA